MRKWSIRLIAALAGLFLLCLVLAAGASAAITSTHITSPADGSYFFQEANGPGAEVTVTGTVESTGKPGAIEIQCDADPDSSETVDEIEEGEAGEEEVLLKTGPGKYSFSVTVPAEEFGESPCILRAVPEGTTTFLPPGTSTTYEGPRVAFSELAGLRDSTDGAAYGYDIEARTLSTLFEIDDAGQCGLGPSFLLTSPGLAPGDELFECAGALYDITDGTRGAIEIDGHNAYDPYAADSLVSRLKPAGKAPSTETKTTFNASTGLTTVHETDPLVECKGQTVAYPETSESCEELVSAGVSLERTWTPSEGGRLIAMSDAWRSTDGSEHTVSALYSQEFDSDVTSPGTYEFPDPAPSFATTKTGESIALPAGGGTILYREDGGAAEAVGSEHAIAGVIFATTPSGAVQVTDGSAETNASSGLTMPYSFSVNASAPATLTMAYAEGYTVAEVCALAEVAGSSCPHGSEAEQHETKETKETTTTTTTTGVTQTATTPTGATTTPTPSAPAARLTTAAKVIKGTIVIALSCSGPSGTSCVIRGALTTLEKLRGGKAVALAAAKRTVAVGSLATSIPAGASRKIIVKLNAAGRALLARFRKLPLHLVVVQRDLASSAAPVVSQTLTVLAAKRA